MSFSATQWATRLSEWSGSAQGDRSWSGLGRSTSQGQYFTYFDVYYYGGGKVIAWAYRGYSYPSQTPTAERNVEAFYGSGYYTTYVYAGYYNVLAGFFNAFANYSYNTNMNWYQPQGYYSGIVTYAPYNGGTYYQNSTYSYYYAVTNYAGYGAATAWSPSTFYNYAPWGVGPYSAGSNISIGAGNGPYSGYPYQYVH